MANGLKALSNISKAVPGLNQQAQRQSQAAQNIMLQQQVQKAKPTAGTSQALSTKQAVTAGQEAVGQQQRQQAVAGQLGQLGLQATAGEANERLGRKELRQAETLDKAKSAQAMELSREQLQSRKTVLDKELSQARELQLHGVFQDNKLQIASLQQRQDLAKIGSDLTDKLVYNRLRFNKDDRGRKFTNERQLADYNLISAQSKAEFDAKMKAVKHEGDKKIQMMSASVKQLEQALKQGYMSEKGDMDRESQKEIAQLARAMREKIAKDKARSRNRGAMWQAAGTVVGAVVGGVASGGNPAGVSAGASIGGAAGSAVSSQGA